MSPIPVITIDGPTASGKGTVAGRVARTLGWHMLDSGALYRLTALQCQLDGIAANDEAAVARAAQDLDVCFEQDDILLRGQSVAQAIRAEAIGSLASRIAVFPALRAALLARQRQFRQPPGLVADGRDMGTIVFPEAALKVFLVASAQARAERRYKQLMEKGFSAKLSDLLQDLEARDARDRERSVAPLAPAADAMILDSSSLSIEDTVNQVLAWWVEKAG